MLHRLGILFLCLSSTLLASDRPPNIVYLMSDELAYYELGHMGNPYIRTPHIDQFAAQGIRFTQALAGSPVCAPLRCNLMTGKHAGHASVRANDGGTPLRAGEATIASILKSVDTQREASANGDAVDAIPPEFPKLTASMCFLATMTRFMPIPSTLPI